MRFDEAQFRLSMARAAYWTALVTSGAYKLRRSQVGCGHNEDGTIRFRDQTDEEKLQGAFAAIQSHLEQASKFADHLPIEEG